MMVVFVLGSMVCSCFAKEEGQVKSCRFSHSVNAGASMEVTESGTLMLVRLLQSLNARSPMEVTLSGMLMLVRLSHSLNALSPIEVGAYLLVLFGTCVLRNLRNLLGHVHVQMIQHLLLQPIVCFQCRLFPVSDFRPDERIQREPRRKQGYYKRGNG